MSAEARLGSASALWKGCHPTNFKPLEPGRLVRFIVIHVMDGSLVGTDAFFAQKRPKAPSSAHYGIGLPWINRRITNPKSSDLVIHQYVDENDIAYHAGPANEHSIGIEHMGTATSEWPDALYEVSASLIADIAFRHGFTPSEKTIVPHRKIDPIRRPNCPGKCDMNRLIAEALKRLQVW